MDDKAYCLAMAAYFLSELRRENITKKKKTDIRSLVDLLPMRQGKVNRMFN